MLISTKLGDVFLEYVEGQSVSEIAALFNIGLQDKNIPLEVIINTPDKK